VSLAAALALGTTPVAAQDVAPLPGTPSVGSLRGAIARLADTATVVDAQIEQPTGPPPTPRHTGIRATLVNIVHDIGHLPSTENLFWVAVGGGVAGAFHPFDQRVNRRLTGNDTADKIFAPGKYLGQTYTLVGTAFTVYAVGRLRDQPKVSHTGMDLVRALAVDELMTESLKHLTHRERPDGSDFNSFPSGHASTTFAFATALERHLGWRNAVPAYILSSYVAASRLHDNRHYLSDVAFGAAVGIIAGRTVTRHGSSSYTLEMTPTPGGAAILVSVAAGPHSR
jgi:membrane-associated phospholipid phosphatase